MFCCAIVADSVSVYTSFAYQLSLNEACESHTEDWSSNFIFTELLRKANTTETGENDKMETGNFKNWNWKIYTDNFTETEKIATT